MKFVKKKNEEGVNENIFARLMHAVEHELVKLRKIGKIVIVTEDKEGGNTITNKITLALMKGSNGKYYVSACGWGLDEYDYIPETISVRPSETQEDAVVGYDDEGFRYFFVETEGPLNAIRRDIKETWTNEWSKVKKVEILKAEE
ncbi:MAG: hypothetical protein ACP5M7_08635 [Thermoproteota archaeon]|jgi:hypothetical protein